MAQRQDEIDFEIINGEVVVSTPDGISGKNHASADEVLKMLEGMLGGKTTKSRIKGKHGHHHHHGGVSHTH